MSCPGWFLYLLYRSFNRSIVPLPCPQTSRRNNHVWSAFTFSQKGTKAQAFGDGFDELLRKQMSMVSPEMMCCVARLAGARQLMEGLGLTAIHCGFWKAEHTIEGPRKSNGVDEEECQESKIRQECVQG
jgi:hypothetical protein